MDEFGTLTCGCGEEYVETVLVQGWESEAVDRIECWQGAVPLML